MKNKQEWMWVIAGVLGLGMAAGAWAGEAPPVADAVPGPASALLERVDTQKWNRFLEDTLRALKQRAEDPESLARKQEALEAGAETMDQVIARLVGVAESFEKTAGSPEFKALVERFQKDMGSATRSLKEVDYSGMDQMLEALTREVVEPLEVVAEQFETHFGGAKHGPDAAAPAAPESADEAEAELEAEVEAGDW